MARASDASPASTSGNRPDETWVAPMKWLKQNDSLLGNYGLPTLPGWCYSTFGFWVKFGLEVVSQILIGVLRRGAEMLRSRRYAGKPAPESFRHRRVSPEFSFEGRDLEGSEILLDSIRPRNYSSSPENLGGCQVPRSLNISYHDVWKSEMK